MQYEKAEIRKKLSVIFEENGVDIEDVSMREDIDSLQYISIMVAIEDELNIEFPDTVLSHNILRDVDNLCDLIWHLLEENHLTDDEVTS